MTATSHWYAGTDNDRRQEIEAGALRAAERSPQWVHGHAKGQACDSWCHEISVRYEVVDVVTAVNAVRTASDLEQAAVRLLAARPPASLPPDFAEALHELRAALPAEP